MSEQQSDPSGNTEAFQAFARGGATEVPTPARRSPLILALAAVAVIVVIAVIWYAVA